MRIRAGRQNKGLARQAVHSAATVALLDRDGLVALWSEIMGSPAPRGMSQALLHAFLAFEVQQRSGGGLTKADLDRLERIGIGKVRAKAPNMTAGARFLREWNGVTHVVERVAAGYLWNGKSFASLSAIAKEITGAHWSGPRFFGVKKAGAESKSPGVRHAPSSSCKLGAKA